MQIAVVIPAYDEAATIADIVRRARQQIERVIVVDDGSRDDTAARAEASGAVVLRQAGNQGKGAGLWRGMRYAVDQRVVGKRLLAKIKGAPLERLDRRRHAGVPGQKNHRPGVRHAALDQAVEQRQPAGARHAHVEQKAGRRGGLSLAQRLLERLGAVERFGQQPARAQQPGQSLAHAGVVVDDVDRGVAAGHGDDSRSAAPEAAAPDAQKRPCPTPRAAALCDAASMVARMPCRFFTHDPSHVQTVFSPQLFAHLRASGRRPGGVRRR